MTHVLSPCAPCKPRHRPWPGRRRHWQPCLTFSPAVYPQTQNICERLNALNSTGAVRDFSGRNLSSLTAGDFSDLSNVRRIPGKNGRCASVTVYLRFAHQFSRKHCQGHSLLIYHKVTRGTVILSPWWNYTGR